MSPQIALHDPVFRAYFWIVLISLAIAGAVLGFLRLVLKKETASMFKTYWSWILIAGIGFIVVFLGRIPTIVGVTLLAIYALKEFARASGLYRDSWMSGVANFGSAWRRTRHGLVRILCRRAGVGNRVDFAHSDFAQSGSRRAAAHIARHYRFCLHRLDVRSPRIYRERSQRIRPYLLHYFRDGVD